MESMTNARKDAELIRYALLMVLLLALAACERGMRPEDLPTRASPDALATSFPLTQNPPPSPFDRPQTAFGQIDSGLSALPGWRYVVQLEFNGVFARTPRETRATARAEVQFNQLSSARRVAVETDGELLGASENVSYEAVRLGPDAFLVRDGVCLSSGTQAGSAAQRDAATAADLRAGDLVGGVALAQPTGRSATLNGEQVWQYDFQPGDLIVPSVRLAEEGGQVVYESGELWIAPARGVVVRFYVNLQVENAIIFDRQLPVSGSLLLRYDLFEVGTAFNISVPFGC
jgi:hypothetical protein